MEANYWSRTLRRRYSRRTALLGTGGAVAAGAFLAACGGSDDSGDGNGSGDSSLVTQPVDTTKQAKRGGKLTQSTGEEGTSWDPTQSGSSYREYLNSPLLMERAGALKPDPELDPDIATSWEIAQDGLTMTFKIRQDAHFSPDAPTNGRAVDIEDVKLSFDYYEKVGNRSGDIFSSVVPSAPITSVQAVDKETLVIKLQAPDVIVLGTLAASNYVVALPKEGINGEYDLAELPRGCGPMHVTRHEPSAYTEFKLNPGYHLDPLFIPDWQVFYIKEYATQGAQFRTGSVLAMDPQDIRISDVLPMKREVPQLQIYKEPVAAYQGSQFFGYVDNPASIFRDARVRQALSMTYDRDLWIDTFHDVSSFEAQGLPIETCWSINSFSCNVQGDWMLDPQNQIKGRELGENAKYFQYNVAEAKKLLAAAGYANGAKSEYHGVTTADYGAQFPKMNEVMLQMAAEAGFDISIHPEEYRGSYRNAFRDARGDFIGISSGRTSLANYDDPTQRIVAQYHKDGDLFRGIDPNGKDGTAGDPWLDDMTVKMRREFDTKKRMQIGYEIQRYDAKQNYYIRFPGGAETFSLAWPSLMNWAVYKGGYPWRYWWIDESKAPFA